MTVEPRSMWEGGDCPRCGGSSFLPVTDGDDVNFACMRCGTCVHVELGFVAVVDPLTCPGCARRDECRMGELARRLLQAGDDEELWRPPSIRRFLPPETSRSALPGGRAAVEGGPMRILVAYASACGSTKGVAQEIGSRLSAAGAEVDVRAVDDVGGVDDYEAVVLGSAIHNGAWLPSATACAAEHVAAPTARPVWLFSVCSVGETSSFFGSGASRLMRRARKDTEEATRLRNTIGPRDHRYFAGAIDRSHWGRLGHAFFRLFRGTYGDHRDWRDIDRWADGIAVELGMRPVGASQAQ